MQECKKGLRRQRNIAQILPFLSFHCDFEQRVSLEERDPLRVIITGMLFPVLACITDEIRIPVKIINYEEIPLNQVYF